MLIKELGWPAAHTPRPSAPGEHPSPVPECVTAGPGLRSAVDELKAQLLTLQVVSTLLRAFQHAASAINLLKPCQDVSC